MFLGLSGLVPKVEAFYLGQETPHLIEEVSVFPSSLTEL